MARLRPLFSVFIEPKIKGPPRNMLINMRGPHLVPRDWRNSIELSSLLSLYILLLLPVFCECNTSTVKSETFVFVAKFSARFLLFYDEFGSFNFHMVP